MRRRRFLIQRFLAQLFLALIFRGFLMPPIAVCGEEQNSFEALQREYTERIRPLTLQFCLDCHSTEGKEGELDLERFARFDHVRLDPHTWQKVLEMLDHGEMPPADSPQLSLAQQQQLRGWTRRYLDAEARARAGDPGPVVLRRLNNVEYTYTVRDLTGVALDPARDFPVDSAAGEGFTNTGDALVMSPSLVTKYLDAAKGIAAHTVLLPDGFRFSPSTTRRDWTNEIVSEIQKIYQRHTSGDADVSSLDHWTVADPQKLTESDGSVDLSRYFAALIKHRPQLLGDADTVDSIADQERLNARYLRRLAMMLLPITPDSQDVHIAKPPSDTSAAARVLLDHIRSRLRGAAPEQAENIADAVRVWQKQLWKFNPVGHFGSLRPWQEATSPLASSAEFRVPIPAPGSGDDVTLSLVCGAAGDASGLDRVVWQNPRFERPGKPTARLRDLCAGYIVLQRKQREATAATSKYLAAAFQARSNSRPTDVASLAAAHAVDPLILPTWLAYLGISTDGNVVIQD